MFLFNRSGVSHLPPRSQLQRPQPQLSPSRSDFPEEIQQAYLEVRDAATQTVVTTIEVISANKRSEGGKKYEAKRQAVLASLTHLVEIDLLRNGYPLSVLPPSPSRHYGSYLGVLILAQLQICMRLI